MEVVAFWSPLDYLGRLAQESLSDTTRLATRHEASSLKKNTMKTAMKKKKVPTTAKKMPTATKKKVPRANSAVS